MGFPSRLRTAQPTVVTGDRLTQKTQSAASQSTKGARTSAFGDGVEVSLTSDQLAAFLVGSIVVVAHGLGRPYQRATVIHSEVVADSLFAGVQGGFVPIQSVSGYSDEMGAVDASKYVVLVANGNFSAAVLWVS